MNFIMIEDHNLVRQGVSKIIEEKSDFVCLGTFATVHETKSFLLEYCSKPDYERSFILYARRKKFPDDCNLYGHPEIFFVQRAFNSRPAWMPFKLLSYKNV